MIGHIEVHQRIGAVGGQDHGQAVVQLVHLVGDGELALLLALFGDQGRCRQHRQGEAQQNR